MADQWDEGYDVLVIGGGAAGLSGALTLARARRSVLVVDAGAPRNAPADGVHALLGLDGIRPGDLLDRGRAEVRGYGGHIITGEVTSATRHAVGPENARRERADAVDDGAGSETGDFAVTLTDGRTVRARRLLVTSGLVDELPDIPGVREQWGRHVLHCPYCHGWEVRDRAIGVLATGPMAVHQALLFRQWSTDITVFTHDRPALSDEEVERLTARGIRIVARPVAAVESEATVNSDAAVESGAGRLLGVRLEDGSLVERDTIVVGPRMVARADFVATLGLLPAEHPSGVGEHITTDAVGRTEVPGVWAAGNVTDMTAQVGPSAAAAAGAAAQINAELVAEDTDRAVVAARARSAVTG